MFKASSSPDAANPHYVSTEPSISSGYVAEGAETFVSDHETGTVVDAKLRFWARPRVDRHWAHHGAPNVIVFLCILDFVLVGGGLAVVFGMSQKILALTGLVHIASIVVLVLITSMGFVHALGGYRWDTVVVPGVVASSLATAIGLSAAASLVTLGYLEPALIPSATSLGIAHSMGVAAVSAGVTLVMMTVSRGTFYALLERGWLRRRVLVVGTGDRALHLRKLMAQDAHRLANDIWFISDSVVGAPSSCVPEELNEFVLTGHGEPLDAVAKRLGADEIVVAFDDPRGIGAPTLLSCKVSGILVTQHDAFIERETGRVALDHLEVSRLIYSEGFHMHWHDIAVKRFLDIALSLAMLVICLPVMTAAIIALLFEGHRPIIFRQERVTLGGRTFWLYKLRTMRPDAEQNGPQWSVQSDPRITRIGAILRRTRIDELPQLFNVLRGDMSLVGPRPERPCFVEQLSREIQMYDLRHSVKSGLTGWAQINYPYGASTEDAARKLEYDLYYIKNYSFMIDVSIVLQTLRVLLWPPVQR